MKITQYDKVYKRTIFLEKKSVFFFLYIYLHLPFAFATWYTFSRMEIVLDSFCEIFPGYTVNFIMLCTVAIPFLFALFVTTRYSFICIDAFDAISPIYSRRRIFVSRRFELKEKMLRKETKQLDGLRNITDDCKDYFDDIFCTYT